MRSRISPTVIVSVIVTVLIVAGAATLAMFAQLATRFHPSINGNNLYRSHVTANPDGTFTVGASFAATQSQPVPQGEKRFVFVSSSERTSTTTAATDDDYIIGKTDRNGDWVGGFTTRTGGFYSNPAATTGTGNIAVSVSGLKPSLSLYTPQGQKLWTQPVTVPFNTDRIQQGCTTVSVAASFENSVIATYYCPEVSASFVAGITSDGRTRWSRTILTPASPVLNLPLLSTTSDGTVYMVASTGTGMSTLSKIDYLSGGDLNPVPMLSPHPYTVTGFVMSPDGQSAVIAGMPFRSANSATPEWVWGNTKITDSFLLKTSSKEFAPWWIKVDKKFSQSVFSVGADGSVAAITYNGEKQNFAPSDTEGETFNSFTGKEELSRNPLTTVHALDAATVLIPPGETAQQNSLLFTSGEGTGRLFLTRQNM